MMSKLCIEQSWKNPSKSIQKGGRGDWKSASEPDEITVKATCCNFYLSIKINDLKTCTVIFQAQLAYSLKPLN